MKLTTKQLTQIFAVDIMTITNWRNPSKSAQKTPLPFYTEKFGTTRHRILFVWKDVKKWAKENRVDVHTQPKDL